MKQTLLLFLLIPCLCMSQWNQVGFDVNGSSDDELGYSTSINNDGSIIAIGSKNANNQAGYVRVYQNSQDTWTQIGADLQTGVAFDGFGRSISLSGDGNRLAVGIPGHDAAGNGYGQTRIYENVAGTWNIIGSINGTNGPSGAFDSADFCGFSVSINNDGSIVSFGCLGGAGEDSGYGKVYQYQGGTTWLQIGSDILGRNDNGHTFGRSTSINDAGDIVVFGSDSGSSNIGYAMVYQNINGVWIQIGSDIEGVGDSNYVGAEKSLDLNASGNIIAVAAKRNSDVFTNGGHVRVFENVNGTWTQIGQDIDADAPGDFFGSSVSIDDSGSTLAIGAPRHNNFGGQAKIFQNINGSWTQIANVLGTMGTSFNDSDLLGESIAINGDGSTVAIGAPTGNEGGSVKVYQSPFLSVDNFGSHNVLKLFPNPSSEIAYISLNKIYNHVEIAVYDLLGKHVLQNNFKFTQNISINTNVLKSGIYVVNIKFDNNNQSLKLIVVD